MKRCILVSSRQSKDEKTGEDLLFLTLYRLPNKMSNGNLWYPKKTEAVVVACINKSKKPEVYDKFKGINPGALIDITYGINDFNNELFVANVECVKGTNVFDEKILYL